MRHIYVAFFILVHIGTSSAQTPAGLCPSFDGTDSSFTKCFGRDVQFAGIRNPGAMFEQRVSGTSDDTFIKIATTKGQGLDIGIRSTTPIKCKSKMKIRGKVSGRCDGGNPHVRAPNAICKFWIENAFVTCLD